MTNDLSTLIDISVPVSLDMPVYEGNPKVALQLQASIAAGDEANVSSITMGVHSGTHIDAPFHFDNSGCAVEGLSLAAMIGNATVLDASSVKGHVDAEALRSLPIPPRCQRLLVKTRNSRLWAQHQFSTDYQGLTADGAAFIVDMGLQLIGWDYLSVAPFGRGADTHRNLLRGGVVILEGIDLRKVDEGEYHLVCLPLLLQGADGAPARAVLMRGTVTTPGSESTSDGSH